MWFSDKKCNPGVGAVHVNVIMIVLQIGPTYQTGIYFAENSFVATIIT